VNDRARRILIVRLSHLGDVVHALPVFHALRAHSPRAEIAWAVQTSSPACSRACPASRA
jgi:ADP-heptose:LPS heptosyltransferase